VSAPSASPGPERGFVGRGGDLDALTQVLTGARSGRGRLVVLSGEAGIGKTSLAEEVADRAVSVGWRLAWAGCAPGMAGRALWPWTAALRGLGQEWPAGPERDPGAGVQVVDELAGVLRAAAGTAPVLVVLDDLQWADPASAELVALLAPLLRGMPVVVLCTWRTESLASVRAALRGPAMVLELTGLSEADVGVLSTVDAGRALSADDAAALHRRTGGNPLFVRELVRANHTDGGGLPATIRDALDGKLAELPPGARCVLDAASVLDIEFDVGLVSEMLDRDPEEVLGELDAARRGGVLGMLTPARARFAHDLFRETVNEELGPVAASRWHRSAAAALEKAAGQPGASARIVHHAYSAGMRGEPAARAASHALVAAEAAMGVRGYATAAVAAERGLAMLAAAPVGDALRARLLLASADARHALGETSVARAAYREAAALAGDAGELTLAGRAALGFAGGPAGFEVPLVDAEQVRLLSDVLERLDACPGGMDQRATVALRARLRARLSVAQTMTDAEPRRRALAGEAVILARSAVDIRALAEALAAHCDAIAGPEWSERRNADAVEVVRIGEALGDPEVELLGRRLRLVALLELGDIAAVDAEIGAYARAAARISQPAYDWYVPLWRAMQAVQVGAWDRWEQLLKQVEKIGVEAGGGNAEILRLSNIIMAAEERADAVTIESMLTHLPQESPGLWVSVAASFMLAAAGRRTEARARLDSVIDALPGAHRDSEWLPMLAQAADAVAVVGGHPVAEWLHHELTPFADRMIVEGIGAALRGSVHRQLGVLDAVLGRTEEAAAHLAAAADANTRLGAPLLAARARRDAAVLLGDTAAARLALATYEELDVPERVAEMRSLLDAATPTQDGPAPARAVAQLRRNGEIWSLRYGGLEARVRDTKGMRDLHRLLLAPGRELSAVDLMGEGGVLQGDLGPVLDGEATSAYRRRLGELEQELADADAAGDAARSARAGDERDQLARQLAAAYGLAGRARQAGPGGGGERARTAVRARIAYTVRKIEQVHPELARHLRRSVRTGAFCSYEPEPPVTWTE
jgi:hypothetical protein